MRKSCSKSKLVIKKSLIHGKGVFAISNFHKYETVFKFADEKKKILHKAGCDCHTCRMCIQIGNHLWLFPAPKSFGHYLNHSCEPNCGIKNNDIVALRRVVVGEEITIDYSTTTADRPWVQPCHCAAKNCRKFIKSVQYLPRTAFKRYANFMPKYVRNNYPQNG
jgi:SET domain-containing protein